MTSGGLGNRRKLPEVANKLQPYKPIWLRTEFAYCPCVPPAPTICQTLLTCSGGVASAALVVSALAACGGGGGGGAPATVSVSDYQLRQAWVNYMTLSGTERFTISGTVNGVAVSGSGTATDGSLVATTFEGRPALSKTTIVTGTLSGAGQTIPYGSSGVGYLDSNYMPLGQSGNEYAVVTGTPVIPQTAKINDTGTLYTATRYPTSQKSYSIGTLTVSYALQPDTADTALLKVIATRKTTSGSTYSTDISTFKMTPAGALTPVSEQYQDSNSALTITF